MHSTHVDLATWSHRYCQSKKILTEKQFLVESFATHIQKTNWFEIGKNKEVLLGISRVRNRADFEVQPPAIVSTA